jgi:hypothetical protein
VDLMCNNKHGHQNSQQKITLLTVFKFCALIGH